MTASSFIAGLIAIVLLLVAVVITVRLARRGRREAVRPTATKIASEFSPGGEPEADAFRLSELRRQTNAYAEQARAYRKLATLFLIIQYVLGAGLATTFVQQVADPRVIGFLGVIVVVASAVANQVKPGDKSVKLDLAVLKLRSMISWAEDQILKLNEAAPGALTKYEIREQIRKSFTEVEENILRTGLT